MDFKEFITEQKNTHMTHIEDKVLYGGVDGTRQAIPVSYTHLRAHET